MNAHLVPLALVALLAGSSCNIIPEVRSYARYGTLDVSGDALIASSGASARADVETAGLDEDDSVLSPRVDVSWLNFDLSVSGYEAKFQGDGRLETTFDLDGTTIMANDLVNSRLDIRAADAVLTFDLIPTDLVDIGIGLGAMYIEFDTSFDSRTTPAQIDSQDTVVLPLLAARAEVELGPVLLNLQGSGLAGDYQGVDGSYYDVEFFLEYRAADFAGFHLGLVLGYQFTSFDVNYDDGSSEVDIDVDLQGPYFGLTAGL